MNPMVKMLRCKQWDVLCVAHERNDGQEFRVCPTCPCFLNWMNCMISGVLEDVCDCVSVHAHAPVSVHKYFSMHLTDLRCAP